MTNQSDQIQPDNPFKKLSIRNLILQFFAILVLIGVPFGVYSALFNILVLKNVKNNQPDPTLLLAATILFMFVFSLWIYARCRQSGIKLRYIFGDFAFDYSWQTLIFITIVGFLFSRGSARLSLGILSLFVPDYVENYLNRDPGLKTSLPTVYFWLNLILIISIVPLFNQFIFQGIILHRLAAKRSINSSIFILSLVIGVMSFPNGISSMVQAIIDAIFYIQSRSLLVPIVSQIIYTLFSIFWRKIVYSGASISLAEFQGQIWWGSLLFIFSAPVLVVFIYKNWPSKHQIMPYFANAAQFSDSGDPE